MAQQIQLRRGTAAAWTSANPTLAVGEPGAETDTGKFKIGDGATAWASLAYSSGAAGADGVAGVVPNAATATLATTHYSAALAARPNPLTDGYAWMQVFAATNPAASDIALSSGTAQPLYSNGAALPAGAIVAGCPYLCRSNGTQVEVLGIVPSTLGATTCITYLSTTTVYANNYDNAAAGVIAHTASGNETFRVGSGGTGKFAVSDKNAAEQFRVDENGIKANTISALGATLTQGATTFSGDCAVAGSLMRPNEGLFSKYYKGYDGQDVYIGLDNGGTWGSYGAFSRYCNAANAIYPGAHQSFAPLTTRAASTALALCPVATGDVAKVELQDDTAGSVGAIVRVDSAGTVTFGYETDAKYVNSSSPGAAEIGVYISAGVLYMKPGSGITPKIASFSKIGKA